MITSILDTMLYMILLIAAVLSVMVWVSGGRDDG